MTERHRKGSDEALAAALAAGATIADAAARAGMSHRTARRRLTEAAFLDLLAEHRGTILARAADRLAAATADAVVSLAAIASDPEAPSAARVSAARTVLAEARTFHDSTELANRVTALEAIQSFYREDVL